ncbi:MAG: MMPL family transporter [Desulfobacterales bacterium]
MRSRIVKLLSPSGYLEWTVRRPAVAIGIALAVSVFFACQIPRLSFKTSVYDLEIEDLAETARYKDFKKVFGSDEIIRVVVKADDVFETAAFAKISALAEAVSTIDGVRRVVSLPGIKKAVDLSGNWSLEKFYTVISPVSLFRKNLFSDDRKTTALTLVLKSDSDPDRITAEVERLISRAGKEFSIYQIGMPLISQALVEFTEKDFFRLPPITFLLIAGVLFFLYRRVHYVLIPLSCVCLALVWTFGLMALLKVPLSMLTMIVPVFLIAVGTAYCLHIVSEYLVCIHGADSPQSASIATFTTISFPTALAVLTTIIGLGSLLVNRIPTIREFALFSCFGMFSLLVITLGVLPAALALIPLSFAKGTQKTRGPDFFDRFIEKIIHIDLNKQKMALPVMAAVAVIAAIGILRIRVETNPVGYFKAETPVIQHFHDIYRDLSGSFPINVVAESKDADYFEDPRHLAEIDRLQQFLATLPGVDKTISFVDYLKLVNYVLNGFDPGFYALPEEGFESRRLINSYASMLGQDMFDRFMSPDLSRTNIVLLTHLSSSREFLTTRDVIIAHTRRMFTEDPAWDVTGFGIVISASSHRLTSGQVKSLALTMILISAIMYALFLSVKVGAIAILPNLFPIVVNFGIMGWLGIELSLVTSLIASIAIGLAVDDTIHYLFRYNRIFRKDLDDKRAIRETLRQIGRPIIFTTVTICVGFSILMFSSFKPTAVFGIMMTITMLAALAGDLILLPSLMQHVELVTLWDLVRVKLGREPAEGIPLFKGFSRTEIHSLIMAGSLKKIEAGEVLFRKGDPSDSMVTIISGTMDVIDSLAGPDACLDPGSPRLINRMKAGDVLGEMGLLRSAPRSATVVACEPVELLPINWKMIKRLQWLYPPTARKFMANLLTILCGRIERLTTCLSDAKVLDDVTGLINRENFIGLMNKEIHRVRRYPAQLSLCLMQVEFDTADFDLDLYQKEQIIQSVSNTLALNVRSCDMLGQCGPQIFGLLFPQTSIEKVRMICNRLRFLMQHHHAATDGLELKIAFGLAGFSFEKQETAPAWLERAAAGLERARRSAGEWEK